jgi:hypothetical protein
MYSNSRIDAMIDSAMKERMRPYVREMILKIEKEQKLELATTLKERESNSKSAQSIIKNRPDPQH